MKPKSLGLKWTIAVTAMVSASYLAGIVIGIPLDAILTLYGLSLLATIWMVVRILKDPFHTDKKFDEFFYQDREDLKRIGPD